jgi:hypothetical protein
MMPNPMAGFPLTSLLSFTIAMLSSLTQSKQAEKIRKKRGTCAQIRRP